MPQTYQCDICNSVAGDFMVTYITDGRVVSVGIECLPLWALPMAARWAEAMTDQGVEVPEWAPIVIDAYRQLEALESGAADSPQEAPEAPEVTDTAEKDPGGASGRKPADAASLGRPADQVGAAAASDDQG